MKEIIFGTKNEAKLKQIRGVLSPARIRVKGIQNELSLPEVLEDGKTAIENARKKATAYAKALSKTVLAMDNALYLEGIEKEKQPGLNVRRIPNYSQRPTDEQMIEFYSKLIGQIGERINGYWEYGICIATPDNKNKETTIKTPRIFTNKPSKIIQPGYPLESLQIDPESGRYMSELTQEEQDNFWQKAIGGPLLEFIQSTESNFSF